MTRKFIANICDELGELAAKQAELNKAVTKLKDRLKAEGFGAYEGKLFRVVVSKSKTNRLDLDAVRAKLSAQFIRANTHSSPKTDVDIYGRTDKAIAA